MGPPGVLCQGRQSPSSTTMAPLFLLHYFPAVSVTVSVHAMLFFMFPGFGRVSPGLSLWRPWPAWWVWCPWVVLYFPVLPRKNNL